MSNHSHPLIANQAATPLKESLASCRVMFKYILAFGFAINILALAPSLYSMQVLDRVLSSNNLNTLLMLTLVILFSLILGGLLHAARAFAMNRMGNWLEHSLAEVVFSNSIRASVESKMNANSQQLRDLQTIKNYLTSPGLLAVMDTPWAFIFIIVLFLLHPWLGSLAVIGGASIIGIGFTSDRLLKGPIEKNNENFIRSMRYVDQTAKNAEVVTAMGMLKNVMASWQKINRKVQGDQALTVDRQVIFAEVSKLIRSSLQIAVTCIGAYLVIKGEFSSGGIIASSTLIGRALAPFEAAINSWKGYINCHKAYTRLNSTFSQVPANNPMALPEPEGSLAVDNVFFGIPQTQKYLVRSVSFVLEPGEILGIIGASGSGKTTLAKLLAGCCNPTIGTVRIDGASLRDWDKNQLGQYIGYLPQDVELFSGTVRENIARMDADADPDAVIMAAQLAGIHEMILQLPKAYDTEIGPDGSVLSGGQRQLLGLARAFYGNRKMMVLDEPNSNLDIKGEAALSVALQIAKEEKITTVIVSHRPSVLGLTDKVLVMHEGAVALFGPREEVLAKMKQQNQSVNEGAVMPA